MHSGEQSVVPKGVAEEAGASKSLGQRQTVVQLDVGEQYFAAASVAAQHFAGAGNPVGRVRLWAVAVAYCQAAEDS